MGPCWARVGPEKFQTKKIKCWEFMFGHFGAFVGPCWGCWGLSWAIRRLLLATFRAINQLQPKNFRLELDFGPCWGLQLGPCWARKIPNKKNKMLGIYVWAFWGLCWAILGLLGVDFGHLGPCWIHIWGCQAPCWAILGAILALYIEPVARISFVASKNYSIKDIYIYIFFWWDCWLLLGSPADTIHDPYWKLADADQDRADVILELHARKARFFLMAPIIAFLIWKVFGFVPH